MRTLLGGFLALTLASPAAHADLVNGSFENGYEGWTLAKTTASATYATWGIASAGGMIAYASFQHDYADGMEIQQYSSGLPLAVAQMDGAHVALQLQNGPASARMHQTVAIPEVTPALDWEMAYRNSWTAFQTDQRVRVDLRDPMTDAVLATLFETKPGDKLSAPLSHYTADLSAFAGQTVRLDVEIDAKQHYLDVQLDAFAVSGMSTGSGSGSGSGSDVEPPPMMTPPPAAGCSVASAGSWPCALALLALRRRSRATAR